MLEDLRELTYRGILKSCNYTCTYCPFGKRKMTAEEIRADKKCLERFLARLEELPLNHPISLLFAPYGEAMIHPHYRHAIAMLSKKPYIRQLGCQTNGSFSCEEWNRILGERGADTSKITLWVTFHPEMITGEEFVSGIKALLGKINVSVGAVGNPSAMGEIAALRKMLPSKVYLWINRMDGLGRNYSVEEKGFFEAMDPMFGWEAMDTKNRVCYGGMSHYFVNGKGEMYACNRRKNVLGHFYESENFVEISPCQGRLCDCYLSYSHTGLFKREGFFGEGVHVRVPDRIAAKAMFLDVDGTLTEEDGGISQEKQEAIRYISKKIPVFLATDLPEREAVRRCSSIRHYLSGGSFSGGAYWCDWLMQRQGEMENFSSKPEQEKFLSGFPQAGVDKMTGIRSLCEGRNIEVSQVLAVGNESEDICMIKECGFGVAVPKSAEEVKKAADYCLRVDQLAYIL